MSNRNNLLSNPKSRIVDVTVADDQKENITSLKVTGSDGLICK